MTAPVHREPYSRSMRRRCGIVGVCLACVTFAAFLPSLNNGFVNRDDPAYVLDNLDIRGCTPHHAAKLFSSTYVSQYVPATMLTYMAEYGLFRLNPAAYHCTSLIIHIVNCLLVFALFYGLSGSCFAGGVTALLFAVHPLRVEAVAWTAERKEVLAALFYLLSLLFYLSYRKKSGKKFYFLCLFSLLISLLSKAMAISQPFLLLCIDYLMNRKIDRKNLLEKAPFFALSAMFAVAAVATAGQFINYYPHYSIVQRALMPAWAIVFYLVKTVVPLNLSASYYLPDVPEKGATAAMALCAVALAAIVAFVYYSRRFSKKAVFGSLFFIITIMPVLQIVNSGGLVLVADRYTYVPMLGIYFIIAAGLSGLTGKKIAKNAVYGGLVAVAAVLSYLTWQRCGVWNDSLTLWNDIIEKSPAAAQAYDGRAGAYRDNGDYNRAIADFNKAMELDPGFAAAYFGRGYIYCAFLGKIDPAIADLKKAVALAPDFPDAWNTLGIAYGMEDSCGPATMGFDRAIALKPDFADAYVNRGLAYMNCSGNPGRAIADFTKAITLDPGLAKAHLLRGILLRMKGSFDEAIGDLNKAIQLDPRDSALAARNRGLASARQAR